MTSDDRFEQQLADMLAGVAPTREPDRLVPEILRAARRARRRPRWLALIKEPPMRLSSAVAVGSPMARLVYLVVITTLVAALAAGTVVLGASLVPTPFTCDQTSCPAGTLTEGRNGHTATLLPDGRVLVIGGASPGDIPTSTTELWDPATRAFVPTGALVTPRLRHSATLLADGRVLVVGGHTPYGGIQAEAELWDPASGTFRIVASLAQGRSDHTATLLPDGRVLVIGGTIEPPNALAAAEVFDPVTETFKPAGALAEARFEHTATLLSDGRVLVVGGAVSGLTLASAELWDPSTMSFSPAGSMAEGRFFHQAALLEDGRVLVMGGLAGSPWNWKRWTSAEVWDARSGSFAPAGTLAEARASFGSTLLPDGRVLVTGGDDDGDQAIGSAEMWDADTSTFSPAGSLIEARGDHTATLLPDGEVLLVGGAYANYTRVLTLAELYQP